MVYGLFRALLGDRAFLPPSPADRSTDLTPASGRQDHTALPSAISAARLAKPKRPPHPALNVRDDAYAPLIEAGRTEDGADLGTSARRAACDKLTRRAICAWRLCVNCPTSPFANFDPHICDH